MSRGLAPHLGDLDLRLPPLPLLEWLIEGRRCFDASHFGDLLSGENHHVRPVVVDQLVHVTEIGIASQRFEDHLREVRARALISE